MNFTILRFDTLDSTNSEAVREAKLGANEGLCIVAAQQTAGRGRHGRTWVSEKNSGLYFSVVLRPKLELKHLPLITLMTGIAVHDLLRDMGLRPDIKWVNDVLIGDRKICGILAETADTPAGLAVIVGIGVNLTSRNFPDEIAGTATSLEAETSTARVPVPEAVAVATGILESLTKYIEYFYKILQGQAGPAEIIQHWRQRSTYFSGKPVRVTLPEGTIEGTTDGLEENGALRVKTSDGSVRIIQAGDVERLRTTG